MHGTASPVGKLLRQRAVQLGKKKMRRTCRELNSEQAMAFGCGSVAFFFFFFFLFLASQLCSSFVAISARDSDT